MSSAFVSLRVNAVKSVENMVLCYACNPITIFSTASCYVMSVPLLLKLFSTAFCYVTSVTLLLIFFQKMPLEGT